MLKSLINHLWERKTENSKIIKITYQPKIFENPNTVDIKSVIKEHPKASHKLSKTIRQAEKLGSNSSLYSNTNNLENFLNKEN